MSGAEASAGADLPAGAAGIARLGTCIVPDGRLQAYIARAGLLRELTDPVEAGRVSAGRAVDGREPAGPAADAPVAALVDAPVGVEVAAVAGLRDKDPSLTRQKRA